MATVDEDLSTLEKDIRQLKVEFDMYFGGGRKRPPTDIQWRIEQMIKRYSERGGQMNFSQRFRFNNLTQSYAKQSEVWRKRMKQKEEGTVERHFGAAARAIEAQRKKEEAARPKEEPEAAPAGGRRPAPASGPAPVFQIACADPDKEQDKVQQLYQRLVEAKRQAGEKTDSLTLENFSEFVRQKTQQLKKQKKTEQVEYAITVEDGQVRLKARVR
jgi:hypothetical protein